MTVRATNDAGFALRQDHGPPVWSPADRVWRLTRHADVTAVLRAQNLRVIEIHQHVERLARGSGRDCRNLTDLLAGMFMFRNAPFHTAARKFVVRVLSDLRRDLSEPVVRSIVETFVRKAALQPRVEAMADLCTPIPLAVMCHALGLSDETDAALRLWASDIAHALLQQMMPRDLAALEPGARTVAATIRQDIARGRTETAGGMARLLRLNDESFGFSDDELCGILFFLALAGFETTSAFLGSAVYLILSRADLRRAIAHDPTLLAPALEEVLRIAPPIRQLPPLLGAEAMEIGGVTLPPGAPLVCDLEMANHDPAVFADPGRFDPNRAGTGNLAFSVGPHSCLGPALARLEGRVLLETMLSLAVFYLADGAPHWQDHPGIRRLSRLDLNLTHHPETEPS